MSAWADGYQVGFADGAATVEAIVIERVAAQDDQLHREAVRAALVTMARVDRQRAADAPRPADWPGLDNMTRPERGAAYQAVTGSWGADW